MFYPRDLTIENEVAKLASPFGVELAGIDVLAKKRALPGGIRADLDFDREAQEELADAWNYLTWKCVLHYEAWLEGDPDAADEIQRRVHALRKLVQAWRALKGLD